MRGRRRWRGLRGNCPGSGFPHAEAKTPIVGDERGLTRLLCSMPACRLRLKDSTSSSASWPFAGPHPGSFALDRAHVPHPLDEIERHRGEREDRDETHQDNIIGRWLEAEGKCGQHQRRIGDLGRCVELGYFRWL